MAETLEKMLRRQEGYRNEVYSDHLKNKTIGIGHLLKKGENFTKLTDDEVEELFQKDLAIARKGSSNIIKNNNLSLSGTQQDALTNMVFQMGEKRVSKFKKTLNLLKQGNYNQAADEALRSEWASPKQTPKRAKEVTDLFRIDTDKKKDSSLGDLNPFSIPDAGSATREMPPLQPEQGQPMERIKLSAEEAAQLDMKETPQAEQPQPSEGRLKVSQEEYDRHVAPISTPQAALMGGAQGITAGFSDEMLAAGETGKQVLENVADNFTRHGLKGIPASFSNIAENYEANHDIEEASLRRARQQHPAAFMAGDIAGSIALGAATIGSGSALTLPAKIGAEAAMGMVHGLGRSEEDTIMGMGIDTLEGAGIGAVAGAIPTMAMAGGAAVSAVGGRILPKVKASSLITFLGDKFATVEHNLARVGKPVHEWAERVVNYVDIEGNSLIKPTQSRQNMLSDVNNAKQAAWTDMKTVMSQAKDEVNIVPDDLYEDLSRQVFDPILEDTIDPDTVLAVDKVKSYFKKSFFKKVDVEEALDPKTGQIVTKSKTVPRDDVNVVTLHKLQSDIFGKTTKVLKEKRADLTAIQDIKIKAARFLNNRVAESVEEAATLQANPELASLFKQSKVVYGDLAEASTSLNKSIAADAGKGFLGRLFNDSVIRFSSAGAVLGSAVGIPGAHLGAAIAGLRAISTNKAVNGLVIKSAQMIETGLKQNPDKFEPIARRLITASSISGEAFTDEMQQVTAEIEFGLDPLDRSTDAVIKRKDTLLTMLKTMDKGLATQLREAIRQKDVETIQMVMTSLAENAPKGYIREGIGWDGKAVTEQDIEQVQAMLSKIKSPRKRMMITTKFNQDKVIPQELFAPQVDPVNSFVYKKAKEKIRNPRY